MRYDRHNLIDLIKEDFHNYPCPGCNDGSFVFKKMNYIIGGPVTVNVGNACEKEQAVKFHIDIV